MRALATVILPLLALPSPVEARATAAACRDAKGVTSWVSPREPLVGGPLRLLLVSETPLDGELVVLGPDGKAAPSVSVVRRGGPPHSVGLVVDQPVAGRYTAQLVAGGEVRSCRRVTVGRRPSAPPWSPSERGHVWTARRAWTRATESLYSAWIEQLFDAPPEVALGFRPLTEALRDPRRNFLHGYLGMREDDAANPKSVVAEPDCADLPYTLRAYFAWKLSLPFGYRDCDRGASDRPPRCGPILTNEQPASSDDPLLSFRRFLVDIARVVHSGSARTLLGDEETDYYPVRLERGALRPGVLYADPYGHVLMISRWVEQTDRQGGALLAVDGQPDTSIGRKRFWEGTFLFASDGKTSGPGFKAFRPIVRQPPAGAPRGAKARPDGDGPLAALANAELARNPSFAELSDEQGRLSPGDFYARVGRLVNPRGLDAVAAYRETLRALVEQLETRVGSVDNGEKFMRTHKGPPIEMPAGNKIFEWNGPWEDYSTPSRDMRLLIAMRVLLGLPDRVVEHPELFLLGGRRPEEVRAEVAALHAKLVQESAVQYTRSDGSPWKLKVAELLDRRADLEVAYNPNDCVEVRWGARPGTPEAATCKRRAPADQAARMVEYRGWFARGQRPPR